MHFDKFKVITKQKQLVLKILHTFVSVTSFVIVTLYNKTNFWHKIVKLLYYIFILISKCWKQCDESLIHAKRWKKNNFSSNFLFYLHTILYLHSSCFKSKLLQILFVLTFSIYHKIVIRESFPILRFFFILSVLSFQGSNSISFILS